MTAQELINHITRLQQPTWELQQRAPRLVRIHPNDMAVIASFCEGDPPMLNGSLVEVSDEVTEAGRRCMSRSS